MHDDNIFFLKSAGIALIPDIIHLVLALDGALKVFQTSVAREHAGRSRFTTQENFAVGFIECHLYRNIAGEGLSKINITRLQGELESVNSVR